MREQIKQVLGRAGSARPARGATLLTYHRVGGGSPDELDVPSSAFARQVDLLSGVDVLSLGDALDRLDDGDDRPSFVLTFDDGFADMHANAWPLLRDRRLPFTVYLATAYVGGAMTWEGATAKDSGAAGLTWDQLTEMVESGLCTVGNHTHRHVRPELLDEAELDACTAEVERHLGVTPRHFAYTWGVPVPRMEQALRARFRSAATGELGPQPAGRRPDPAAACAGASQRPGGVLHGQARRDPGPRADLRGRRRRRQEGGPAWLRCRCCAAPAGDRYGWRT